MTVWNDAIWYQFSYLYPLKVMLSSKLTSLWMCVCTEYTRHPTHLFMRHPIYFPYSICSRGLICYSSWQLQAVTVSGFEKEQELAGGWVRARVDFIFSSTLTLLPRVAPISDQIWHTTPRERGWSLTAACFHDVCSRQFILVKAGKTTLRGITWYLVSESFTLSHKIEMNRSIIKTIKSVYKF